MTKFYFILIGTLAIGLFTLPAVISTFTGSHEYVAPENVECQKCHPDVYNELMSSQSDHTHANADWGWGFENQKKVFDCVECHTVSDIGGSPGSGHAARKVDCAICHNKTLFESTGESYFDWAHVWSEQTGLYYKYKMNCDDCHTHWGTPPSEGMFLDDVYETITSSDAAHHGFFMNAVNDTTHLLGGTESCVGCHSHVDFTITKPLGKPNMTYDPETGKFGREE